MNYLFCYILQISTGQLTWCTTLCPSTTVSWWISFKSRSKDTTVSWLWFAFSIDSSTHFSVAYNMCENEQSLCILIGVKEKKQIQTKYKNILFIDTKCLNRLIFLVSFIFLWFACSYLLSFKYWNSCLCLFQSLLLHFYPTTSINTNSKENFRTTCVHIKNSLWVNRNDSKVTNNRQ